MTIKRCTACGNGFSTKKSKRDIFCSIKYKLEYNSKIRNVKDWKDKQIEMDFKAKQKAKNDDFRLPRYR